MGRRTTIEVDDDLLAQAQAALGTTGLKATVDAALNEAVRRERRAGLIERIRSGEGFDRSPPILEESRPTR